MLPTRQQEVCYIVSPELLRCSDALPSNIGRSSLVHSLVYHLGLLDLRDRSENSDADGASASGSRSSGADSPEPSSQAELFERLRGSIDDMADATPTSLPIFNLVRRARVVQPEPATPQQLKAYHAEAYVDALLDAEANEAADEPRSSKRRKLNRKQQTSEDAQWGLVDVSERCDGQKQVQRLTQLLAGNTSLPLTRFLFVALGRRSFASSRGATSRESSLRHTMGWRSVSRLSNASLSEQLLIDCSSQASRSPSPSGRILLRSRCCTRNPRDAQGKGSYPSTALRPNPVSRSRFALG